MADYASTSWELRLANTDEAKQALLDAMQASGLFDFADHEPATLDAIPAVIAQTLNEDSSGDWAWDDDENSAMSGGGSGKCRFDDDLVALLAAHSSGYIDVSDDNNYHWRYRLADGSITEHEGEVTFPTDPGE